MKSIEILNSTNMDYNTLNTINEETFKVLMGRKSRDKGRGIYKQRDKKDVSKQPPKKKKPN